MSLQKRAIQRYRQFYPQDTLKEVSTRTGIQITRVFRLFNGKPMKVKELEAFETAVSARSSLNPHHHRMLEVIEQASAMLTPEELSKIHNYIERKIVNRSYERFYIDTNFETATIA